MTHRRTKIVCTLGPASSSREALLDLVGAGLNVARVNFSHGTHESHAQVIAMVRAVSEECGKPVAILGDLQGPRIRIGDIPAPITLEAGMDVVLAPEDVARGTEIPTTYAGMANDVRSGDRILVDDGLIELVVHEVRVPRIVATVVHGGTVKSHKGMNLPGIPVSVPSLTEKDIEDVRFAIEQQLDYLALSFVRRAADIAELRALLPREMLIVAKIEKDVALEHIDEVIAASDGVMVARGDLGVELPFEQVPIAQKKIINVSTRLGRPVITATQMLESMIQNPRPTRAEASDVANAILDGTDAVMLSAETAAGRYPRLAVQAMARIIREIESHPLPVRRDERLSAQGTLPTEHAIAAASVAASRNLGAPLIMVFTKRGFTARVVASHRPGVPILAITDELRTYRQLAMVWGVAPELVPPQDDYDSMVRVGLARARERGLVAEGDRVVVTAGVPFDVTGTTNLMKVETA
ncbi:MAG TPA: pyruvate kinase [Gemmatimonadaceae bacterium]|nr:pyruvate kinase [Gemmatimonadaceae bacterium]